MSLNHKNNRRHSCKNPNSQLASQPKETSLAFTGCVLKQRSQRQTDHMMSHRQHRSVANPESHSPLQWKLAAYQNSGKLLGNFNSKHENNGLDVSKGPLLMVLLSGKLLQTELWTEKRAFPSEGRQQRNELVGTSLERIKASLLSGTRNSKKSWASYCVKHTWYMQH